MVDKVVLINKDARTLRQSLKSALTIGVFGNQKAELLHSPGLTNS
jgi:hypothetical protein